MVVTSVDSIPLCEDEWTQKADFPGSTRRGAVSFTIGNKAYVGTGYNGTYQKDFYVFDMQTESWDTIPDFPGASRDFAVAFVINGKAYVGTGFDGGYYKDFYCFDPDSNSWSAISDFPGTARRGAVSFTLGNKGYVGTGFDGTDNSDFWSYDPVTDNWSAIANYVGSRRWCTSFVLNGKGYVGLGFRASTYYKIFQEYDPVSNTWSPIADFNGSARYGAFSFVLNDQAYVGCGYDGSYTNDVWKYSPVSDDWRQVANFGGGVQAYQTAFTIGNKGYVCTGQDGSFFKDFWEYCEGEYAVSYNYGFAGLNDPNGNDSLIGNIDFGNWTLNTNTNHIYNSNQDDNVGIGLTSPAYDLHLAFNSAAKPLSSSWTVASDQRLKTNVREFSDGLEVIKQIKPVWFEYNGTAGLPTNTEAVGTIAQELKTIAPYMVHDWTYVDEKGNSKDYLGVDYGAMDFVIVNAIKEQQNEIEEIQAAIANSENYEEEIAALQATILKQEEINRQLLSALQEQGLQLNNLLQQLNQVELDLQHCCLQHQTGSTNTSGSSETGLHQDQPHLAQNVPNPFSEKTIIRYYIPNSGKGKVESGMIRVMDLKGTVLWRYDLVDSGYGQIEIDANTFAPATYIYELIVGDKKIDSKKMVIE